MLIPEVQPARPWQWLLHNQRGIILNRAIRRGTSNVVLCRLRYRLETLTRDVGTPVDAAPQEGEAPQELEGRDPGDGGMW